VQPLFQNLQHHAHQKKAVRRLYTVLQGGGVLIEIVHLGVHCDVLLAKMLRLLSSLQSGLVHLRNAVVLMPN